MELADLMESHSAMFHFETKFPETSYKYCQKTNDIDEVIDNATGHTSFFVTLFQFDRVPECSLSYFMHYFTWPDDITHQGYDNNKLACMLEINPTQTGHAYVSVRCKVGNGNYVTGSWQNIIYGDTYALVTQITYTDSTHIVVHIHVARYTTEGTIELWTAAGYVTSSSITLGTASMVPDYAHVYSELINFNGSLRLYELMFLIAGDGVEPDYVVPHLWGGKRYLSMIYYGGEGAYQTFVFPPKALMDGSAYDRTDIMLNQIYYLEADVATLTIELENANIDIGLLQDELDIGGPFRDWLAGLLATLNDGNISVGTVLRDAFLSMSTTTLQNMTAAFGGVPL